VSPKAKKREEENMPNALDIYSEAMERFNHQVAAYMDSLSEARKAYEEALQASGVIRKTLTSGDEAIKSAMARLQEVAGGHLADKGQGPKLVEMPAQEELPVPLHQFREIEPKEANEKMKDEVPVTARLKRIFP
jgi:hypothetical protein